jgi:hypothetical protein
MYKYPFARQSLETYGMVLHCHFSYLCGGFKIEERSEHALQVVISFTTCQEKVLKTYCVSNVHFMTILSNRGFEEKCCVVQSRFCCCLIDVLQV